MIIPLTLVAALVSIETFLQSRRIANQLYDQTLLSVMLVVSENAIATEGDLLSENILESLSENLGDQFFYHVAGPNGVYVIGYTGVPANPEAGLEDETGPIFYDSVYQGDPVRVVTLRQLVADQEINGWMKTTAWQRISQRQDLANSLFVDSIIRLLVIVMSAGAIVWVALSYGLKPLQRLRLAIEKRSADDLTPIRFVPPVEVKEVVQSMNGLFGQVAKANEVRERFIGDAAHQLRNPIAAIKTQSETALDGTNIGEYRRSIQNILDTTDNTGRLVEQLLTSARAHAENPKLAKPFELEKVVKNVAEANAMDAIQRGFDFAYESGGNNAKVRGYPRLFGEAVSNLIDNSIRHTPGGSQIVVGLESGSDSDHIDVYVADEGPVFDETEFIQLLQPFSTGNTPTQGSGLGLSVVDDIVKMHGGFLSVKPGRFGKGKEMIITLPVMPR